MLFMTRDEFNLIKGTKKSYVWSLVAKGYDLERVTRRMKKKFPDANDPGSDWVMANSPDIQLRKFSSREMSNRLSIFFRELL